MIGAFVEWDWLPNIERRQGVAGHVITESGCWEWIGTITRTGYGQVSVKGVRQQTHRLAYEHYTEQTIPNGMFVDHICRNTLCCNPHHLRVVTPRQNALENSVSPPAANATKEHCKSGHPLAGDNLYTQADGKRCCRKCACEKARRYRKRHPERAYKSNREHYERNRERINARERERWRQRSG